MSLDQNVSEYYRVLNQLSFLGINLNSATQYLEQKGIEIFIVAFNRLIISLKEKQRAMQEPLMS